MSLRQEHLRRRMGCQYDSEVGTELEAGLETEVVSNRVLIEGLDAGLASLIL